MIRLIYKYIQKILKNFNWIISVQLDGKDRKRSKVNKIIFNKIIRKRDTNKINLNIGAGDYVIDNFISLDFFNKRYYSDKKEFNLKKVSYDMRNDNIPFQDETVDNIYCSHVIEHVEEKFADKFFKECKRVLKKNGVLRVVVPDAKYLFKMCLFENSYYAWHKFYGKKTTTDMLIEKICTNKNINNYKLKKKITEYEYLELMNELTFNSKFDKDNAHNHINICDYDKIDKYKNKYNFSKIIYNKVNGSISKEMQGDDFDIVHQNMSLYVDLLK